MAQETLQNDVVVKSELDTSPVPGRAQSVKFSTAEQSSSRRIATDKSGNDFEAKKTETGSIAIESNGVKVASQSRPFQTPLKTEDSYQGAEISEDIVGFHGSQNNFKTVQNGSDHPMELVTTTDESQEKNAADVAAASRPSTPATAVTEYTVSEDGNIHINDDQKAAIRRLMHPEDQEDNFQLRLTKEGKPIKANPYYKYAQRARDGAEDTKPSPPPVTEPHASRLTRRSRRESAHLPTGPSPVLEKVKEEFCEWLASLGSSRNMVISKERLEKLFSLGLENNLVVRPPEVRMTQSGQGRPPPESSPAQSETQQRRSVAAAGRRRRKTETGGAVAYHRSPSLTYYPELREKWRQMGLSRRRPVWRSGKHPRGPLPRRRVHYGDWYIPIQKWSPLEAGSRLAPPETDEARQLRQRERDNRNLNETLSRSHAMSALREYIHICQLQGNSAFPEATPKLVRDVDELVAELALEARGSRGGIRTAGRVVSMPMAGLMVRVMDRAQPRQRGSTIRRGSRRQTVIPDREPLITRPPPMYKPVKTAPGHAARRKRRMTATGK